MDRNIERRKRSRRIKAKTRGEARRPRLSVFRSLKYLYIQLIDDASGKTIVSFDSRKLKGAKNNIETAKKAGKEFAKLARSKKIEEVIFDRSGYKYHGKIKALAEGAREEGLKF